MLGTGRCSYTFLTTSWRGLYRGILSLADNFSELRDRLVEFCSHRAFWTSAPASFGVQSLKAGGTQNSGGDEGSPAARGARWPPLQGGLPLPPPRGPQGSGGHQCQELELAKFADIVRNTVKTVVTAARTAPPRRRRQPPLKKWPSRRPWQPSPSLTRRSGSEDILGIEETKLSRDCTLKSNVS